MSGTGAAGGLAAGPNAANGGSAEQQFLGYMKETPAQRMVDGWLKSHNLTRAQFDALPPDQKAAIQKQMANDIRDQLQKSAADKADAAAKKTANIQSSAEVDILV